MKISANSLLAAALVAGLAMPAWAAVDAETTGQARTPTLGKAGEPAGSLDETLELDRELPGTRELQPIRDWAAARLSAAREAMNEDRYEHAEDLLEALQKRQSLNLEERSATWRLEGHLHAARENYTRATKAFEESLKLGGLPADTAKETRFNLAQIYMMEGRYDKAVSHLETWMLTEEDPAAQPHYVLAMAYAHAQRKTEAIRHARTAVAKSETPHEGRLQLLAVLLYEEEIYDDARRLIEKLVASFPKKTYWTQLVAVNSELGRYQAALAVQEAMYEQDLLEDSAEHVLLAQLLLHNEIPYEAAKVLEAGLDNGSVDEVEASYELLASSYLQAQEYDLAIPPLEKAAALAASGEAWIRLGQVYLGRQRSSEAKRAFVSALAKGGLEDPGRVHLLIGMAEASEANAIAASAAFEKAMAYASVRDAASQWLAHLQNESQLKDAEAALQAEPSG